MLIPLFPSFCHSIEIKDFKKVRDKLIDFVYEQENKDPMGVFFSNAGGWQSSPNYQRDDNIINSTLQQAIVGYFDDKEIFNDNFSISCTGMWLNINRNTDHNRLHCHADSDLSGVLWIKVPKNCDSGNIQFASPHQYTEFKPIKILNQSTRDRFNYNDCFAFIPKEGTILLFPSHLMHEVRANQSREDRISVSFNLKIDMLFHSPNQTRGENEVT